MNSIYSTIKPRFLADGHYLKLKVKKVDNIVKISYNNNTLRLTWVHE